MTMAIRIIRTQGPSDANLQAVEREEQILAVARRVVEASGFVTQDRMDACVEKLRSAGSLNRTRGIDKIAEDIANAMMSPRVNSVLMAHAELDMDRILALLEG